MSKAILAASQPRAGGARCQLRGAGAGRARGPARWLVRPLLFLLLACLLCGVRAEQAVLEVIALRHRTVEQVLPVLRPLVAPGGTVTGMNGQLIVRTTPDNLAELKAVLARLDTRPRRLMISVRQDADIDREGAGAEVSGRVEIGDDVVVSSSAGQRRGAGAGAQAGGARARVWRSEGSRAATIAQRVQVIEGGQAMIRIGESTPVRTRQFVGQGPDGPAHYESREYRDTDRGFIVVPRLSGDEVTLELSAAADTLRPGQSGAVDVQRVQTTVSGRLGEWIEVAGIGEDAIARDSELLARSRDARREARRVLLKVDELE